MWPSWSLIVAVTVEPPRLPGNRTAGSRTGDLSITSHLDIELSMKQHIAEVAATCFYHKRRLRQIRRRVSTEVTIRLVLAVVMLRVDYCNSVLAGLPQSTLAPLQRVQNAAARLVFELQYFDAVGWVF